MDDSRRIHPANSGRSSKPALWGFEGSQLTVIAAGFGVSLAFFRLLYATLEWGFAPSLIVCPLPLAGATLWVAKLMRGKPPRYAWESIDWLAYQLQARLDLPTEFLAIDHSRNLPPTTPDHETQN